MPVQACSVVALESPRYPRHNYEPLAPLVLGGLCRTHAYQGARRHRDAIRDRPKRSASMQCSSSERTV
eukprot:COSAG06_NODE_4845_length_3911_cov_2.956978_5_plen_68_part_00